VSLLRRLRRSRPPADALPDPAKPPENRGTWDAAALTNVDVTEYVKTEIRTQTRPWQR